MGKKEYCSKCKRQFRFFRWKYKCQKCRKDLCNSCLINLKIPIYEYLATELINLRYKELCNECYKKEFEKVKSFNEKHKQAMQDKEYVDVYPIRYKNPPYLSGTEKTIIETDYYKDRDDAEISLRVSAAFLDCNIVFACEFISKKNRDGNYIYKTWQARGIPAKKKPKRRHHERQN